MFATKLETKKIIRFLRKLFVHQNNQLNILKNTVVFEKTNFDAKIIFFGHFHLKQLFRLFCPGVL